CYMVDDFRPAPLTPVVDMAANNSTHMNLSPVYTSNCTRKSLWQKYEIFEDRVELHTWVGKFKIPFDQIQKLEVYPRVLQSLRLHLRNCLPIGIKLDTADFKEHVILDRQKGDVRHLLFTPA